MKKLFWTLAVGFMFVMNYLAISLPLNGLSTAELSDKLTTLITPAGFTFAIRSVIYLGILIISYLFLANKTTLPNKAINWFIVSCLANGLRIVAWHYENLHLSMILILLLLGSLIMVDQSIKHLKELSYYTIIRNSILLYFGWVQVASLLMTTIYLTYQLKWIDNQNLWRPIAVLVLAGLINIVVIWKEKNATTMLVFLWALFGIWSTGTFQHTNRYLQQTCDVATKTTISGVITISKDDSAFDGPKSVATLGSSNDVYRIGNGLSDYQQGGTYSGTVTTYKQVSDVCDGFCVRGVHFDCIGYMDFLSGSFSN